MGGGEGRGALIQQKRLGLCLGIHRNESRGQTGTSIDDKVG